MAHPLLQTPRGRTALFGVLYFSEGAPIGFLWWAMPALLRSEGVPIERITALTAALVLPWTGKFLWAPLVDALRGPRWGFRHWAMAAQAGMGLFLVPLLFISPQENFAWWAGLLLAHAFCAATQDVAIDALAVAAVPATERGRINGAMQAGMLLGRGIFGGGALLLAAATGLHSVFAALIAVIWVSLFLLMRGGVEPPPDRNRGNAWQHFGQTLRHAFAKRITWMGLGFALTAGAGFEAVGALAGPFLIDQGVAVATTGFFFGAPVVAAMLVGSLVGGRLSDRLGRRRTVGIFLAVLCVLIAGLGLAVKLGAGGGASMIIFSAVYLAIGLFTASSYALFMDLTDPKLGATQFSTFMAATNGCEAWAVWTAGRMVGLAGYGNAFLVMTLLALAGFLFLRRMGGAGEERVES